MDVLVERLARLLSDGSANFDDEEVFGLAVAALAIISAEQNWYYLYLLCLSDLRGQRSKAARTFMADLPKDSVVQALIANHRINEALHVRLAEGADPTAGLPLHLPARRWNLAGTDRWLSADDVRQMLAGVQDDARRTPQETRQRSAAETLMRRAKALNDRMKDAALMQMMRHAGALNGMQWRRLTKESRSEAVHVRLHYASAMLTASIRVGDITARSTQFLPLLFAPHLGNAERRGVDSHFAARVISARVYDLLLALHNKDSAALPLLQGFYGLLLGELLARPHVARAIDALGIHPTLIVATHGALAQIPFAALHDGQRYLVERFQIAQAPPLYSDASFTAGDMDYEAMTGGEAIALPRAFRVMADTVGLPGARREVGHYRAAKLDGVNIEINDGTSTPWTEETLRWLVKDSVVAILSSHVGVTPHDALATWFVTPDKTQLGVANVTAEALDADLLVLAGCVSVAKTDWFGGIEDSLASRFRKAGVKSIVTTLWPVNDDAAQIYNETLVTALHNGQSRAAAHVTAQRAVMRTTLTVAEMQANERKIAVHNGTGTQLVPDGTLDHPYFWAPFVLSGAWR